MVMEMQISDVLGLLGGLALFLYGMQMMSAGLEAAAGNRMKRILEKLTANRFLGVLVGAGITAAIQSSSATTVMVVGFVNSAMDDDDFRRGKPSNHKVFGEGMAVLAGDGLLSYAFEVMLSALALHGDNPGYLEAVRSVAGGAGVCGMVAGQAADLESEGDETAGADRLQYIHARKTGAIIKAAALAGAHIANADARQLHAISEFGSLYGLLFQITDDILDVEGDFTAMGKTLGKDKEAHKLTYVNLYGLETAKQMAEETAQKARNAVACFGSGANYLTELVDITLERKH